MKRVALVTAHFPPSNLVGVHRARLWAQHLPEFGWTPTIVTSHWKHYQEPLDWDLVRLLPEDLEIVRTNALGVRFAKLLGNMALRAMWWTRKELARLVEHNELDFVHIIVPDHYSALLGPLLYRSHGVPYGIDYMDPWVHASPNEKRFLSKAWISCALSYHLEPRAVKSARLITGVTSATFEGVFNRNPLLEGAVVTAEIPMASSESDFRVLSEGYRPETRLFDPDDGRFHVVYAGTIPPSFDDSLSCFLSGLSACIAGDELGREVCVWLIGTGTWSHGSGSRRVKEAIDSFGLSAHVKEHPSRIGYVDALWHLKAASAVVVLGSNEPHYTPSKAYQAVNSGSPVLALLPGDCGASSLVRSSGRGIVVNYSDGHPAVVDGVREALNEIVRGNVTDRRPAVGGLEMCSARTGASRLAQSLDRASCR